MRKFVIDRSKWLCGHKNCFDPKYGISNEGSLLLSAQGSMCCLGQIANQCKVPKKVLLGKLVPPDITKEDPEYKNRIKFLIEYEDDNDRISNSSLASRAMEINDQKDLSQKDRERKLKKLFKEYNIELEFIGRVKKNSFGV